MSYIVTIKLPRNPDHDPRNKVTGPCPANPNTECTDVTGEHHSVLVETQEQVAELFESHLHVTRAEKLAY